MGTGVREPRPPVRMCVRCEVTTETPVVVGVVHQNSGPGFVVYASGRPLTALIFHVRDGRIQTIYAVGNPDKLRNVAESGRTEDRAAER